MAKGESTQVLAAELGLSYGTVLSLRHALQARAAGLQPERPLPDAEVEADEMFQNAGEKGAPHRHPDDPPRRRGTRRRGHGTYENDRPPILWVVGRTSGQVRLRMLQRIKRPCKTLCIVLPERRLGFPPTRGGDMLRWRGRMR